METMNPNELPDETPRLASLRALDILDTPAEERFDRITRLATRLFNVPIATIGLVDEDRLWFKSRQGLTTGETPRNTALCRAAIHGRGPFVVNDARADERTAQSPLVTAAPFVRFFAAHALSDRNGRRLGTLSLADTEPREFDDHDHLDLQDLALIAQHEICRSPAGLGHVEMIGGKSAQERHELIDPITGLWGPDGILEVLRFGLVRARYESAQCAVIHAQVGVPTELGTMAPGSASDEIRAQVAQLLRHGTRAQDAVGAWKDGQFLVVLFACDRASADSRAQELRRTIAEHATLAQTGVRMNQGWAAFDPDNPLEAEELIARAGRALAEACNAGSDEVRAA